MHAENLLVILLATIGKVTAKSQLDAIYAIAVKVTCPVKAKDLIVV